MKFMKITIVVLLTAVVVLGGLAVTQKSIAEPAQEETLKPEEKLVVLWTSADREVALKMAFMYTYNSIKYEWWKDVTLVVWGPSAKLLSEDKELQDYIKKMLDVGIHVKACKACADMYEVSDMLTELGVEVKYMGELTDYLKNGRHVLSL